MSRASQRRAVPRVDALAKVTGAATYAADITRPGMLWARVLRSTEPHALIRGIETSRAAALPGVHAVLSGLDLPDVRVGRSMRDMPVLAREKVRFVGEKVAAVAADSPELAEQALGLIEVDYEPLPAVFDPLEAMRPGAPLIHDPAEVRARKTAQQVVGDYPNSVGVPTAGHAREAVEAGFARSTHVFEHTFRTPIQHQGYLEPHACLVELDARGVAHIWASNKAPYLLLDYMRLGLGLERDQIEIHLLPLGGDFGGKGSFMDIPLAYFLAKATGRPVKLVMSYVEELTAGNPRHAATIVVKSGFDRDGRLLARLTRSYYASGAYAAFKPARDATLPNILSAGRGPYEAPVWRVEGHMIYTNGVPGGHMRGPGEAQPLFAIECHMDLCAHAMGIDPLELRLRNAPDHPRQQPDGQPGSRPKADEALRAAANAIGWGAPLPPGVGRGLALVEIGNSLGDYGAEMVVRRDGQVELHTPMIENGAGMLTVFRQLVAEALGIPLEQVAVVQTMENIRYDRGVGGSRITRILGRMIGLLGERLQTRLAGLLAAEYGCQPEQVRVEAGGFRAPDGRLHSLAEVAALADEDLAELLEYPGQPSDRVEVFAAQAAEVEVDAETGQVRVRRIVTAHEVGRVVDPLMHQGQIDGGLIQGFGFALTEGLVVDEGRVLNTNLHEYKLPSIADVPPLETIVLEPDLSLGISPIGEGPNCGLPPCLVNAVVDAVRGLRGGPAGRQDWQLDIPLSSDAIRRLAGPGRRVESHAS